MSSPTKQPWPRRTRLLTLAGLLVVAVVLLVVELVQVAPDDMADFCGHDFSQYWCASNLLRQHANPYDATVLLNAEHAVGWDESVALMMWNPPWTLVLALPYSLLPFSLAAWAWLATSVLMLVTCGAALWSLQVPGDRRYWLGIVLALAYLPTWQGLRIGQISPWLLMGITGFLLAERHKHDGLAGASLALLTIKPHVGYLFLAAAAWWIIRERRWRVLLGGAIALAAACGIVGLISPQVFGQYLQAAGSPPLYWRSATLGTWLRTTLGWDRNWLQFLPSAIGLIVFTAWATRHRGVWNWPRLAPGLLLASVLTASYGWGFDQVILLPAVVALFGGLGALPMRRRIAIIALYGLAQVGLLVQTQLGIEDAYTYWHPLVLAGLYHWRSARSRR